MKLLAMWLFAVLGVCLEACSEGLGPARGVEASRVAGGGAQQGVNSPMVFSTYLGEAKLEESLRAVTVDSNGDVYAAGGSKSRLPGLSCGPFRGAMDAVIIKTDRNGVRKWCRLYGGAGYDRIYDILVAPDGNLVVGGRAGRGLPVTPSVFDRTFDGSGLDTRAYGTQNGFVCKIKALNGDVIWCSYFGNGSSIVRGIAVDSRGAVYLASGTCSNLHSDPSYGSMLNTRNAGGDGCDAVVGKVSADGRTLSWARYVGGSGNEGNCGSVGVDSVTQAVYHLTCQTNSADMPTPGGFDKTLGGRQDVHLARFSADGSSVDYGTYIGGNAREGDGRQGLAVVGNGVVFVHAFSRGSIPATAGAYQTINPPGLDATLWKIDTSKSGASSLLAATYLGGNGDEDSEAMTLLPTGDLLIGMHSTSTDLKLVGRRFACTTCGGMDAYVAVLSSDLSTLKRSFRLGGSGDEGARAVAYGGGVLAVVGNTHSADLPTLAAWDATYSGGGSRSTGRDGFITLFAVRLDSAQDDDGEQPGDADEAGNADGSVLPSKPPGG